MSLYVITKIVYDISVFFFLSCIIYKVIKEKYLIVTSLIFWCTFFYFFYISFSCFFIETINVNWNFSDKTLTLTRLLVIFYNVFFTFLIISGCNTDKTFKSEPILKERCDFVYKIAFCIEIIASFIIFIAVFKLWTFKKSSTGLSAYFSVRELGESLEKGYHIRLFLYLLLASSFYLYMKKRNVLFFIPLLLIILFEVLANKRTTAFIVLLYLYVLYVCIRRKLELKIIVPLLFLLLVGVLFVRGSAIDTDVGFNLIFGEFFETFTTIPYMIEDNLIGAGFNLERILCDYTFATFIPGSIRLAIASYDSAGTEMAHIIGRGYGLASNFIFEPVFQFGYFGFIISIFIPLLLVVFDKKLKGWGNLIIKILFIFQLRLYIREGITQFMIVFYIFVLYYGIFYFFYKKTFVKLKVNKKKKKKLGINYLFKYSDRRSPL